MLRQKLGVQEETACCTVGELEGPVGSRAGRCLPWLDLGARRWVKSQLCEIQDVMLRVCESIDTCQVDCLSNAVTDAMKMKMAGCVQWTWVWANSRRWWWKGSLVCCSPWGCKESDMTEWLNNSIWFKKKGEEAGYIEIHVRNNGCYIRKKTWTQIVGQYLCKIYPSVQESQISIHTTIYMCRERWFIQHSELPPPSHLLVGRKNTCFMSWSSLELLVWPNQLHSISRQSEVSLVFPKHCPGVWAWEGHSISPTLHSQTQVSVLSH